eukprot:5988125-Pyramimonas_sp.AAC.1
MNVGSDRGQCDHRTRADPNWACPVIALTFCSCTPLIPWTFAAYPIDASHPEHLGNLRPTATTRPRCVCVWISLHLLPRVGHVQAA